VWLLTLSLSMYRCPQPFPYPPWQIGLLIDYQTGNYLPHSLANDVSLAVVQSVLQIAQYSPHERQDTVRPTVPRKGQVIGIAGITNPVTFCDLVQNSVRLGEHNIANSRTGGRTNWKPSLVAAEIGDKEGGSRGKCSAR
jgi:hypothetical protein